MNVLVAVLIVSCVTWTITQEEIFKEVREWLRSQSAGSGWLIQKVAYLPTCHYCFSHWVTILVFVILRSHEPRSIGWMWYFPVVWMANHSMTIYGYLRQVQKRCSYEAKEREYQCRRWEE